MADTFVLPSQIEEPKTYKRPGDFERATRDDRPYVYLPCLECEGIGRVDGKRAGTHKQCPKCKGAGKVRKLYSRFTTFIDCLSDRTLLEQWKQRIILTGLEADWKAIELGGVALFDRLHEIDLEDRDTLNAIAESAFDAGDGFLKAQQGTDMHALTEAWDRMQPLPAHDERERKDFRAWLELIEEHDLRPVDIERKCVVDKLQTAGTPDRTYWYKGELVLGDLKTGASVTLDPGKNVMQMALAARGLWYDPDTDQRYEMGVSQDVALILHVPNGAATATLYEANIGFDDGWYGIELATQVRQWRNMSKKLLTPVAHTTGGSTL